MNFLINGLERQLGYDLNGDGYIGGEGFMSKLERITHIDFNRDNIIGRPPDVYYPPYGSMYGPGVSTGYPPMSFAPHLSMGYPNYPPYGYF